MGPSLSETDFFTIVTFIKGELTRILSSAASVDGIKTYITNLVKYIEATEQSSDVDLSDTDNGKEGAQGNSSSGAKRRTNRIRERPDTALLDAALHSGMALNPGTVPDSGAVLNTDTTLASGTILDSCAALNNNATLNQDTALSSGTALYNLDTALNVGTALSSDTALNIGTTLVSNTAINVGTTLASGAALASDTAINIGTTLASDTAINVGTTLASNTALDLGDGDGVSECIKAEIKTPSLHQEIDALFQSIVPDEDEVGESKEDEIRDHAEQQEKIEDLVKTEENQTDCNLEEIEDDKRDGVEAHDDDDDDDNEEAEKGDYNEDEDTEIEDAVPVKEEDPLTCSGCGKAFGTARQKKDHVKRNPGRKRFKCLGCCKAFKHNVSLKLHVVEENHGFEKYNPVEFQKFMKKLFVCEICKKRFLGQSNLDRHMLTHTGGKPYQCIVCLKQFKQKRSLLQHSEREGHSQDPKDAGKNQNHKTDHVYRCRKCDRIFTAQNQLNSHMKVHAKGANHTCNHCGRCFTRKETLEKHIARDCSGDVFPVQVKCSMCEELFNKKSLLDIHLASHMEPVKEEKNSNVNVENFISNAESGNFNNDEINALANQIALGILGQPDSAAGATGSGTANQNPPVRRGRGRRPGEKRPPYQCSYCPKIFNRRKEWRNHQYLHTGEKPHVCDICGKTFRLRQVLTLHIATHGGNKFKCNICDKTYPYKNQLVRHSYTHSGIKPYKCEQCGKGFISKPELNRHYGVHGGGKTFVCETCGKSCKNIKKHMQAVHSHREKVRCEICNKEYVSKSKLKTHMQTHTSTKAFICPICGKGFAMNKYLSKHMILSHGEKKHKCQLCGKAFAFTQQLKMHERTHTVENPGPPVPPAPCPYPYYPQYPMPPSQFW